MRSTDRVALAHRLKEVTASPLWAEVLKPYLEGERVLLIELMASQTDALQLMRYAGSIQTLSGLVNLEERASQVIEEGVSGGLKRFSGNSS